MKLWNWFWNLLPSNKTECMACGDTYAKDAMKELWFRYQNDDGSTGTSSLFVCQPCIDDMAEHVEDAVIGYDDFEIEVDGDV